MLRGLEAGSSLGNEIPSSVNATETSPPFPVEHERDMWTQPPQQQPQPNGGDFWPDLLAVAVVLIGFYCWCCRGHQVPGPEHWRGAELRRQYQERLERQRLKKEKEEQTPEYRHRLVSHNMRTKVSLEKRERIML